MNDFPHSDTFLGNNSSYYFLKRAMSLAVKNFLSPHDQMLAYLWLPANSLSLMRPYLSTTDLPFLHGQWIASLISESMPDPPSIRFPRMA